MSEAIEMVDFPTARPSRPRSRTYRISPEGGGEWGGPLGVLRPDRRWRLGSDENYVNAVVTVQGVPSHHPQRQRTNQNNRNSVIAVQSLPPLRAQREPERSARSDAGIVHNDAYDVIDMQSQPPLGAEREPERSVPNDVRYVYNYPSDVFGEQDLPTLRAQRQPERSARIDHNYANDYIPMQRHAGPCAQRQPERSAPNDARIVHNYANDVIAMQGLPTLQRQRDRYDDNWAQEFMAAQGLPLYHPRRRDWTNVEIIVQPLLPLHPHRELPDQNGANEDIPVQGGSPHDLQREGPEDDGAESRHKTSYLETLMQLLKGNVGTGCYAMGVAFKNGGLLFGAILTCLLGFVCVHCQHVLINCAKLMRDRFRRDRIEQLHVRLNNDTVLSPPTSPPEQYWTPPDFAETVGLCFRYGPRATRRWATPMRRAVNVLICVSQFGFCCVYVVFISSTFKQIADRYGLALNEHQIMALLFIPVTLTTMITKLKFLSYCSLIANVLMAIGIGITFYYALKDPLPPIAERRLMGSPEQLPLFFGIAIFAFEGIALVLPLQNEMKYPADFSKTFGVLNVGMVGIVSLYTAFGFVGYLRWGDEVESTMALNLPDGELLAESVKLMVSTGVLLGFALQFFVAIMIMWPSVGCRWRYAARHPVSAEIMFRVAMVLLTFVIAACVPKLSLFISLIGAFCSSTLGLIIPLVIELIVEFSEGTSRPNSRGLLLVKNGCILFIALLGFGTGTYASVSEIIQEF